MMAIGTCFPLGMYELPRNEEEWAHWKSAGINLLPCASREDLDSVHRHGMKGWVSLPMVLREDDDGAALRAAVSALKDHPALYVWEAPDEIIWNTNRRVTGVLASFWWDQPERMRKELAQEYDALVLGLERGSAIVRSLDPGRPIWLNEAARSDMEIVSRCLPFLDIISTDFYPVLPQTPDPRRARIRTHDMIALLCDRFRATAPDHEFWFVQQAFSWHRLERKRHPDVPIAYPTRCDYRFMAWQAIAHGARGLLWYGSAHEDRPAPFLDDLMAVVRELSELTPFLLSEHAPALEVRVDTKQYPPTRGVSCFMREFGGRTFLALVNEDPYENDVLVTGVPGEEITGWTAFGDSERPHVPIDNGFVVPLSGREVRLMMSAA